MALSNEEFQSVLNLDAKWEQVEVRHDYARYLRGRFQRAQKSVDVVVVAAPRMGMPPSTVAACKLIQAFRPRVLAMTGICAGIAEQVKIGDVLVADPCWDWGSGKWVKDVNSGGLKFRPASYQWRLNEVLRAGITEVGMNETFLATLHANWKGRKPENIPRVIVEAVASGASVLQARQAIEEIQNQHKNLTGVEMENFGVFTAAEYASEPRPKCVALKAVCDYGDEEKTDSYHQYAAYVSANVLYEFALTKLGRE